MPYKSKRKRKLYERERHRTSGQKRRAMQAIYRKTGIRRAKDKAFEKLGNRCSNAACQWLEADGSRGCRDKRCLQVDHVRGNGHKERKLGVMGHSLYKDVLNDNTGKYQLLCANCNWIKRVVNNENKYCDKKTRT